MRKQMEKETHATTQTQNAEKCVKELNNLYIRNNCRSVWPPKFCFINKLL